MRFSTIAAVFEGTGPLGRGLAFVRSLPALFPASGADCDLFYQPSNELLVVPVRLDRRALQAADRARFEFWVVGQGGKVLLVDELGGRFAAVLDRASRAEFSQQQLWGEHIAAAIQELTARYGLGEPPPLRLELELSRAPRTRIIDLSEGGVFIHSATAPPVGEVIPLAIESGGGRFELEARVAHVRRPLEAGTGRPAGFGLEFLSPSRELLSILSEQARERRAHPRHPYELPMVGQEEVLRVIYDPGGGGAGDLIENLSQAGAYLRTRRPLPAGARLRLELELPGGIVLDTAAKVVRSDPDGMALSFELDEHGAAMLAGALERIASESRHALIVESNVLVARILSSALSRRGFEVELAPRFDAALRAVAEGMKGIDLIICTVDGGEEPLEVLIEQVRDVAADQRLVIIVIASQLEPARRERLISLGVDEVFDREILPEEISRAAARLVRSRAFDPR